MSLITDVQTGGRSTNCENTHPLYEAIEKYAFSLSKEFVQSFFDAEAELFLRIPVGDGIWARLNYKLNRPIEPITVVLENYDAELTHYGMFHGVTRPDPLTYRANFSATSLPLDAYDSRGQPARTVDTIVTILEYIITTTGIELSRTT